MVFCTDSTECYELVVCLSVLIVWKRGRHTQIYSGFLFLCFTSSSQYIGTLASITQCQNELGEKDFFCSSVGIIIKDIAVGAVGLGFDSPACEIGRSVANGSHRYDVSCFLTAVLYGLEAADDGSLHSLQAST